MQVPTLKNQLHSLKPNCSKNIGVGYPTAVLTDDRSVVIIKVLNRLHRKYSANADERRQRNSNAEDYMD